MFSSFNIFLLYFSFLILTLFCSFSFLVSSSSTLFNFQSQLFLFFPSHISSFSILQHSSFSFFFPFFFSCYFLLFIGEMPDRCCQDVITDALFSPILPLCTPFQPPEPTDLFQYDPFPTIPGFLFCSRLTSDGIWQVQDLLCNILWCRYLLFIFYTT